MRIILKLFIAGFLSLTALTARADPATDAAIAQITAFNNTLLQSMKVPQGRETNIADAIDKTFNTPVMTQFVVGPSWAKMTPAEKRQTWRRITQEDQAWRFNRYAERALSGGMTAAAALAM